jgi:hypothetical protein
VPSTVFKLLLSYFAPIASPTLNPSGVPHVGQVSRTSLALVTRADFEAILRSQLLPDLGGAGEVLKRAHEAASPTAGPPSPGALLGPEDATTLAVAFSVAPAAAGAGGSPVGQPLPTAPTAVVRAAHFAVTVAFPDAAGGVRASVIALRAAVAALMAADAGYGGALTGALEALGREEVAARLGTDTSELSLTTCLAL